MWSNILEKLEQLKSLDKNLIVDGAGSHRYCFNSPATSVEIERAEVLLGVSLPSELRFVYSKIGNGGAGPDGGLVALHEIQGLSPAKPWPGITAIDNGASEVCGLLAVMSRYYNYSSCVVVSGQDAGNVIAYEEDMFAYVEGKTLESVYLKWLESRVSLFSEIATAFNTTRSIQKIAEDQLRLNKIHPENCLIVAASVLGWGNIDLPSSSSPITWHSASFEGDFTIERSWECEFSNRINQFLSNPSPQT